MIKVKNILTEDNLINILITASSSILTSFVKMCSENSPPHIYIPMYLAVVSYFAVQSLGVKYWGDMDKLTVRHVKWSITSVFVTALYFFIGNPALSIIISIYLAVCQSVLFHGKEEKPMTWEEVRKVLNIV